MYSDFLYWVSCGIKGPSIKPQGFLLDMVMVKLVEIVELLDMVMMELVKIVELLDMVMVELVEIVELLDMVMVELVRIFELLDMVMVELVKIVRRVDSDWLPTNWHLKSDGEIMATLSQMVVLNL